MNKADLIEELYRRRGEDDIETKAAAGRIVNDVLDIISDAIKNDGSAHFVGFGSFDVVRRAARNGVNPQTHKKMKIAATKTVRFKPSQELKDKAVACKSVK